MTCYKRLGVRCHCEECLAARKARSSRPSKKLRKWVVEVDGAPSVTVECCTKSEARALAKAIFRTGLLPSGVTVRAA